MKTLILNEWESKELKANGVVEIERNGFPIIVEEDEDMINGYSIFIVCPYENLVIKK